MSEKIKQIERVVKAMEKGEVTPLDGYIQLRGLHTFLTEEEKEEDRKRVMETLKKIREQEEERKQ